MGESEEGRFVEVLEDEEEHIPRESRSRRR